MDRQRVLVLENDAPLEGVLRDLFGDEGLDVTACTSLTELQAGVQQYPRATVVSDSWAQGDYLSLSPKHHAEIVALGRSAPVILTTGRAWAKHFAAGELNTVEIIEKPYELARLLAAVRVALKRASILGRSGPSPSVAATDRGRAEQPHEAASLTTAATNNHRACAQRLPSTKPSQTQGRTVDPPVQ